MKCKRNLLDTLAAACALIRLPRNIDFDVYADMKPVPGHPDALRLQRQASFETMGRRLRGDTQLPVI